jgi:A/G-specific adenine glycosylase
VLTVSPAPTLDHAFSHFRLRIAPLVLEVRPRMAAMEPGQAWVGLDRLGDAALPAPVRSILAEIQASGSKPLDSRKR